MTPRKILGGLSLLSASLGVAVSGAIADELKVFDQAGTLRSAANLNSGETANLKITIKGFTKGASTTVALEDSAKKTLIQSTPVNDQGVALFNNVPSGAINVKPSSTEATVATVEITPNAAAQHGKNDVDSDELTSKSIYLAGASAVAGVLGISIANSDGSDGGADGASAGSGTVKGSTATNTGNAPGTFANTDGSSDDIFSPSALNAVDPGTVSPAPSTITANPVIPEPLAGGAPTGIESDDAPAAPPPPPAPSISGS
mgnify:CR=1 FL=1